MRLCSAAAGKTGSPEAAKVSSSAASMTKPAAATAAGARGDAPHDIGDYELELIYSGESDGESDSKEAKAKDEPELTKRSQRSRLPEALKASQIVVTSSDRPTSQTLRFRDGVVRMTASKAVALATGTILTVMQSCITVRVIGMIMVSVLLLTPSKRLRTATSCAFLLRRSRGNLLGEC
uniref:RxLR effector candidate protein n=1 Tax=Hyaloperonospora arabidopsidis (strain Emoy2) TaxID=559515 RepID=M4B374_HYAAE